MKRLIALTLLAFVLAGCSTFNREWKAALAEPHLNSDISGAWEGRWLSDKNGHTGNLRAVLRQNSADEYDAFFHATFWKIFSASYRVPLKAEQKDGRVHLSGSSDLGRLSGGIYGYEAEVTPASFFSTYKSKYDHGTFDMKRPASK